MSNEEGSWQCTKKCRGTQHFSLVSECMEKHQSETEENHFVIFMAYKLTLMTSQTEEEVTWKGEFNECGESKNKGVRGILGQGNKKWLHYLISCIENCVLVILKYVGDHLRPRDMYYFNSRNLFPFWERNTCVNPVRLFTTGIYFPSCNGLLPVPIFPGLFWLLGSVNAGVPYVLAAEVLRTRFHY